MCGQQKHIVRSRINSCLAGEITEIEILKYLYPLIPNVETKIYLREKLGKKWKEYAMKRFGYGRGSISRAAEEALEFWILREEAIEHMLEGMVSIGESEPQVLAIMLFGSYARLEIYRDLDIAVVLNKSEERLSHLKLLSMFEAAVPDNLGVDLSIFNDLGVDIRSRIMTEGKLIYVRDMDTLYDLSIEVIREYGDFAILTQQSGEFL